MKKYKKERFAVGIISNTDGYIEACIETLEYPMTGVKRYYHTLFRLLNLSGCERGFLDWLTEVMNPDDNSVYVNEDEILRFISTVSRVTSYKPSTVWQAFKRLRSKNLVLKVKKASGLFHVNPIFFSRGTEKDRLKAIRMLMEFDTRDDMEMNEIRIKIFRDMKENLK